MNNYLNYRVKSNQRERIILRLVVLLFLSICSLPAQAEAEISSIELLPGDITFKPGAVLKLKALALQSNPGLDIDKASLVAVEVLAKSRQGKGTLRLRVGNQQTIWAKVAGAEKEFDNNEPDSYSSIKIRSPEEGKKKVWQLIINGYLKIQKIILYMTETELTPGGSV